MFLKLDVVFLKMCRYRKASLKLFWFMSLCWYISRASVKPNLYISETNKSVPNMTEITKVNARSLLECAFMCSSNINCFQASYEKATTNCYIETKGSVILDTMYTF